MSEDDKDNINKEIDVKAKEDEQKVRQQKEEKFIEEKIELVKQDNEQKKEMIEKVIDSLPEDDKVQEMANQIVEAIEESEPVRPEDRERETVAFPLPSFALITHTGELNDKGKIVNKSKKTD